MSSNKKKLSLSSYLDFAQLLESYQGNHEENRIFALKHKSLQNQPFSMLQLWAKENRFHVTEPFKSQNYLTHLRSVTHFLALLFLVMGFIAGLGLLSYSGEAPVNVIYYLFIAMVIPLLSMVLSLFSMLTRGEVAHFFTLFFPLHWFEKLVQLFPSKSKKLWRETALPLELTKWMFIERMQRLSLLFSIGLLIALVFMVVVKDIAFGWSTTLNITPDSFHVALAWVGIVWQKFVPSAIPSLELVEISQYFRLGEKLDTQMIDNAHKLGAWWQFLAMTTLVYAIGLRLLFWLFTRYGYQKHLKKEFMLLEGVDALLYEFQTPFVSTEAPKVEKHLEIVQETNEQVSDKVRRAYNNILGWNFSEDEIALANDSKEIKGSYVSAVGGSNTFSEDEEEAKKASRTVLLYVKSWEPPTMDFVDFVEMLIESKKVDSVQVYPLGTVGRYYESDVKDIAVWKRKIQGLKSKKVWVIDA
ncbi:MAG: DUF2868 domain-containing protein [Epsilonproteobacteria bacterium]|nr:DUF2868 domain-containing protein [Campylobacterota bacterium]